MADDASSTPSYERRGGPGRGGRGGASRGEGGRGDGARGEAGGFRIRLSDNEMQAARALQEAFGLRSTVAVLGFCLRSLAQLLEQGKLDELIQQQRALAASRPPSPGRDGERRGGRGEAGGGGRPKADPFARPSRPASTSVEETALETPPVDATAPDLDSAEAAGLDAPGAVDAATSAEAEGLAMPDSATETVADAAADAGLASGSDQA
ncbi:MAG: hypothetical protein VKI42_10200 [Synechococcaceae cyanobacterium]|nr:hypothetical protein [Synechococcaceae cyanobacterium]